MCSAVNAVWFAVELVELFDVFVWCLFEAVWPAVVAPLVVEAPVPVVLAVVEGAFAVEELVLVVLAAAEGAFVVVAPVVEAPAVLPVEVAPGVCFVDAAVPVFALAPHVVGRTPVVSLDADFVVADAPALVPAVVVPVAPWVPDEPWAPDVEAPPVLAAPAWPLCCVCGAAAAWPPPVEPFAARPVCAEVCAEVWGAAAPCPGAADAAVETRPNPSATNGTNRHLRSIIAALLIP